MRIAIFNYCKGSDYFNIGGNESLLRRLTAEFVNRGVQVDWLLYGAAVARSVPVREGIQIRYFPDFSSATAALADGYDHVITTYILPKDRLGWAKLRRAFVTRSKFHFIYLSWPENSLKRLAYFGEAKLFPYNGQLFCVSRRQYDYMSTWSRNTCFLLPPVSASYFVGSDEKNHSGKIRISFLGRVDLGKGIHDVLEIFRALGQDARYECVIYGIHFPFDRESVSLHKRLLSEPGVTYVPLDRQEYSPSVERFVQGVLRDTDIFLQPYQRLSSTIDTPLLLLEAMASLCVVITKPFGNIPDVYGNSHYLIGSRGFPAKALEIIRSVTWEEIKKERIRIARVNSIIDFRAAAVANRFLSCVNE